VLVAWRPARTPVLYNSEESATNKPALVVTARPATPVVPPVPTAVTASVSDLRITLSWAASAGGDQLQRLSHGRVGCGNWGMTICHSTTGLTTTTTIDFTGVENTRYRYARSPPSPPGRGESDRSASSPRRSPPSGPPSRRFWQVTPLAQAVQVSPER